MPITIEGAHEESLRTQLTKMQFQNLLVHDQASYNHAAETLIQIKTWRSSWKRFWYGDGEDGVIPAAHKSWKGLLAKYNEADVMAEASEKIVKNKLLVFDQEQEAIQRKRQEEADRIAREKEEADRAAKAAEMEVMEVSDDEIQEYLEAPSVAVAPVIAPTYQKVSSISKRDNWGVEITDLKALFKALGAGKFKLTPGQTLKAKEFFESLLKPHATANTSTLSIPGVTAVNRPIIGARSK